MILSGSSDGLIAVSSPNTGMTVRVITDHRGAPITNIDVPTIQVSKEVGVLRPVNRCGYVGAKPCRCSRQKSDHFGKLTNADIISSTREAGGKVLSRQFNAFVFFLPAKMNIFTMNLWVV